MPFCTLVYAPYSLVIDVPALPQAKSPLAIEILNNLAKFPHCILLTRVGQFYEVHMDYFPNSNPSHQISTSRISTKLWKLLGSSTSSWPLNLGAVNAFICVDSL